MQSMSLDLSAEGKQGTTVSRPLVLYILYLVMVHGFVCLILGLYMYYRHPTLYMHMSAIPSQHSWPVQKAIGQWLRLCDWYSVIEVRP